MFHMNLSTKLIVSLCVVMTTTFESVSSFQVSHRFSTRTHRLTKGTQLFETVENSKEETKNENYSGENEKQIETVPILSEKESILAMDPSTIEVVPFNSLSEEGKVLGGAYSGTSYESQSKNESSIFGFVNMFRGSANYIANHRNTVIVYHIPGELLEWDGFNDLMDDIALSWLLGMKPVIVAGCRSQINARISQEIRKPDNCIVPEDGDDGVCDSVRITDLKTLRIVQEEAGYVRFEIERLLGRSLHRHGMVDDNALKDGNVVSGNFFSAQPYGVLNGVDFQFTGFPRKVESEKIKQVLDAHDVVLLTSLGASPSGEIFNVNTEHLTSYIAGALEASKVVYFTVHGSAFIENVNDKLVQNMRVSDARNVLKYNNICMDKSKGFYSFKPDESLLPASREALVKLGWCVASLERGVKRAHIISPINGALLQELYTRDGGGTLISRDIYEGIRAANVGDVAGIYDLIEPLVKAGTLKNRSKSLIENEIDQYYIFTRDNLIVACAQIKIFEEGYAEIGCLVVKKEYRSQGRGDAILGYLERLSLKVGCKKVFVLSTQTMEWFVERGFSEVPVEDLPPSRRANYNYQRRSKVYMKKIENERDLDTAELWWNR